MLSRPLRRNHSQPGNVTTPSSSCMRIGHARVSPLSAIAADRNNFHSDVSEVNRQFMTECCSVQIAPFRRPQKGADPVTEWLRIKRGSMSMLGSPKGSAPAPNLRCSSAVSALLWWLSHLMCIRNLQAKADYNMLPVNKPI